MKIMIMMIAMTTIAMATMTNKKMIMMMVMMMIIIIMMIMHLPCFSRPQFTGSPPTNHSALHTRQRLTLKYKQTSLNSSS